MIIAFAYEFLVFILALFLFFASISFTLVSVVSIRNSNKSHEGNMKHYWLFTGLCAVASLGGWWAFFSVLSVL